MSAGIFFTFYLGIPYLRHPRVTARVLFGGGRSRSGGESPLRSLCLALAGTLGVGNIVGVSAAIVMGGAGAVFWMWVSALAAMILKYAEIVLCMRHRKVDGKGGTRGSASFYIKAVFEKLGMRRLGTALACIFSLLCVLESVSMGGMIQSEAAAGALENAFGLPLWLTGLLLGALTFLVIRGGKVGIVRVTDRLVPLMTLGYVVVSLAVIILGWHDLPHVFYRIFREAFTPRAAAGGAVFTGIRYGVMRGLVSNEAGCGTAPMAHGISGGRAAEQGLFGVAEVFVDTVLLCSLTALTVLLRDNYKGVSDGDFIGVTVDAYSYFLGRGAEYFMGVSVLLFGFATVICWGHFGVESIYCLFGEKRKRAADLFTAVYSIAVMVGATSASLSLWRVADLAIGGMTLINLIALVLARRQIRDETRSFFG